MSKTRGIDPKLMDETVARIRALPGITVTDRKGFTKIAGPLDDDGPRIYVSQGKTAVRHVHLSGLGADTSRQVGELEGGYPVFQPWPGCLPLTKPNGRVSAYLDVDAEGALARLLELAAMIPQMGQLPASPPRRREAPPVAAPVAA